MPPPTPKLTNMDASLIRGMYDDDLLTISELADAYGMSKSAMHALLTGKTYKHAGGPIHVSLADKKRKKGMQVMPKVKQKWFVLKVEQELLDLAAELLDPTPRQHTADERLRHMAAHAFILGATYSHYNEELKGFTDDKQWRKKIFERANSLYMWVNEDPDKQKQTP